MHEDGDNRSTRNGDNRSTRDGGEAVVGEGETVDGEGDLVDDDTGSAPDGASADESELPPETVEAAERLTRLARRAVDENERSAYEERREALLDEYGFTSRVRSEDDRDVLVCHPAAWLEDGVVRTDRIEDLSRAVEVPLEGAGDPDDWDELDAANRALVEAVREEHGDVHGDNAAALADFMGNHCAKPIASATAKDLEAFLTDYFVRNAWPSEEQRAAIEESIRLVFETADEGKPGSLVQ